MYVHIATPYRNAHRERILRDRDDDYPTSAHVALSIRVDYAVGGWGGHITAVLDASNLGLDRLANKWHVVEVSPEGVHDVVEARNDTREQLTRAFVSGLTRIYSLYRGGIYRTAAFRYDDARGETLDYHMVLFDTFRFLEAYALSPAGQGIMEFLSHYVWA